MLGVRIGFSEIVLNVNILKNVYLNKTVLPCVWCCVYFCFCAFGAILKRFRRVLIFHVHSPLGEKNPNKEPGLLVVLIVATRE